MQRIKARYFIEWPIHGLFWLIVYYALKALTAPSFQFVVSSNGTGRQSLDGRMIFPYAGIMLVLLMMLFYSSIFFLFGKLARMDRRYTRAGIVILWLLLWFGANYLIINRLIQAQVHAKQIIPPQPPPPSTPSAFPALPRFTTADWLASQWLVFLLFLAVLGMAAAYFFFRASIRSELLRNRAEALQLNTELRFLRSQVNPHFLFNTLNNLFAMAQKKGNDDLANGIAKLASMMRYLIDESNADRVPLSREVEYLSDSIALNKLRYSAGEVSVSFSHPEPAAATVQVAPMLLVPFVENAFKHGVIIGGHTDILITLSVHEKKLTFICENTLPVAIQKQGDQNNGIGLDNVRRRLELLYPDRHRLLMQPANGTYRVDLQIDLS